MEGGHLVVAVPHVLTRLARQVRSLAPVVVEVPLVAVEVGQPACAVRRGVPARVAVELLGEYQFVVGFRLHQLVGQRVQQRLVGGRRRPHDFPQEQAGVAVGVGVRILAAVRNAGGRFDEDFAKHLVVALGHGQLDALGCEVAEVVAHGPGHTLRHHRVQHAAPLRDVDAHFAADPPTVAALLGARVHRAVAELVVRLVGLCLHAESKRFARRLVPQDASPRDLPVLPRQRMVVEPDVIDVLEPAMLAPIDAQFAVQGMTFVLELQRGTVGRRGRCPVDAAYRCQQC